MVLTARQKFFIERLSELLHVGTLDSYRVRTHNVHTLILELHTLIEQWRKGNIKQFETIQLSARETKDKIENDKIYLSNFPFRHLLPNYLENFAKDDKGNLETTGARRTGCSMCGFGIHMEERPHRFDRLRERNPKEWEFYMYQCCTDPVTWEKYGWGRVLDYIGVEWEDVPGVQMSFEEDFPEVMP